MNIGDIIILVVIFSAMAGIVFSRIKRKKAGKKGCTGNCAGCRGCAGF